MLCHCTLVTPLPLPSLPLFLSIHKHALITYIASQVCLSVFPVFLSSDICQMFRQVCLPMKLMEESFFFLETHCSLQTHHKALGGAVLAEGDFLLCSGRPTGFVGCPPWCLDHIWRALSPLPSAEPPGHCSFVL